MKRRTKRNSIVTIQLTIVPTIFPSRNIVYIFITVRSIFRVSRVRTYIRMYVHVYLCITYIGRSQVFDSMPSFVSCDVFLLSTNIPRIFSRFSRRTPRPCPSNSSSSRPSWCTGVHERLPASAKSKRDKIYKYVGGARDPFQCLFNQE